MRHKSSAQSNRIFLSPPFLNGNEIRYIQEAIASNYIAPLGPQVDAFENLLKACTGRQYVVALSAGTAAMHLALQAAGVVAGDQPVEKAVWQAQVNGIYYS